MGKIAFAIGTRAELIKTFPVLKRMDDYVLIHTGQHSLGNLLDVFGLKAPDYVLSRPPDRSTKFYFSKAKAAGWSIGMVWKIRGALKDSGASVLVYHGDTMTTAAAAVAAKLSKAKGVHLEAGLRSGSIKEPFPEEISRRIADSLSDVALAVSKGTEKNLKESKWFRGKVVNVGNTVVDAALEARKMSAGKSKTPNGRFAVVTVHRHENIRSKERMRKIVRIVGEVPIETYFFAHDNTLAALKKFGLLKVLAKKVKLVRLSGYLEFIQWIAKSSLILTDGGSIQEESLVFGKPCLILRNRTERTEGLGTGINFLTELDVEYAKKRMEEVLSPGYSLPKFKNPYGGKGVSDRVVGELKKLAQ